MRIFVSYSHQQIDWVKTRLVPCLTAGGAEVLIDYQHFTVGKAVIGQMDSLQDTADKHLLVLSHDYIASAFCQHEMQRAFLKDPSFSHGLVLPVLRETCSLPNALSGWNPAIWADLTDDTAADRWQGLLKECDATSLGATAPDWLAARDEVVKYLQRGESVNLLVNGNHVSWRGLLGQLGNAGLPDLVQVDLQDPKTTSREGLLQSIADAIGARTKLPAKPHDLAAFSELFKGSPPVRLCLHHFDLVAHREYYDMDLFSSLRYLTMETRQLVLLIQSRTAFGALVPVGNPLSAMDIKTVEIRGKP